MPARRIRPPIWMAAPETVRILATLSVHGTTPRFVGGCVRDAILGRPVKDIDIVTSDKPEAVMALCQAANLRVYPTGIAHGTVTAFVGERSFEITTLRQDVETFGRHARVAFTNDWVADAARRDFTINALFADADGTIYDPTGGLTDLDVGRVRFVGAPAERIREDALRLLRFFRFQAHYGRIPPDEAALVACAAAAKMLHGLSGERLWQETMRLFAAPDPLPTLKLMQRQEILQELLPGADDLMPLQKLLNRELKFKENDPLRRLSSLYLGQASVVQTLADRFRPSNLETERLLALTKPEPSIELDVTRLYAQAYRYGRDIIADRLLLWANDFELEQQTAYQALRSWTLPKFPITGADVLMLGWSPGPAVGEILQKLEEEWIAANFKGNRESLLVRLKNLVEASLS